jgi:hypothetical protein
MRRRSGFVQTILTFYKERNGIFVLYPIRLAVSVFGVWLYALCAMQVSEVASRLTGVCGNAMPYALCALRLSIFGVHSMSYVCR